MRRLSGCGGYGQRFDFVECHGPVPIEPLVFGSHFSCAILKLPGWIGKDGTELAMVHKRQQIGGGSSHGVSLDFQTQLEREAAAFELGFERGNDDRLNTGTVIEAQFVELFPATLREPEAGLNDLFRTGWVLFLRAVSGACREGSHGSYVAS